MNFILVLLEKLMVYNGILMETIRISVMVSIGLLLLFFLAGLLSKANKFIYNQLQRFFIIF